MMTRTVGFTLAAMIVLTGMLWVGCSSDSDSLSSGDRVSSSGIAAYFPLDQGYTTVYQVTSADGTDELVTYRAASETTVQGLTTRQLIQYIEGSITDTSYIRTTSTAVFHFSGKTSSAEKMLEMPFTRGASWDKDVYNDEELTDSVQVTNDNLDKTDQDSTTVEDGTYTDVDPQLTFPISGSITMTVAGMEPLELANGEFFSTALKIQSSGQSGKTNYYWYVPGVGLAKYVLGAYNGGSLEGETVGQLVSYGF